MDFLVESCSIFVVTDSLKPGEILMVPHGFMIVEACLGGKGNSGAGADMVSFPFLMEADTSDWINKANLTLPITLHHICCLFESSTNSSITIKKP